MDEIARLLRDQDGVIARRQALDAGMTATQVARAVRRREWVQVHRGVYVEHTGPLTWQQRAWAAVLTCWPAAICGPSALRAYDGPGRRAATDALVHVLVDRDRHLEPPTGVRLHRSSGLSSRVQWNLGPPRTTYDDTVLDLAASARDELDAVAVLADACGARRTTARRLEDALARRPWIARRDFLRGVLHDVAAGACSVLEHGYLTSVVRPHGLPEGALQVARPTAGGVIVQDVAHDDLGLLIELDGRLFHSSASQRDRDLARDFEQAAEAGRVTLRIGYGQVFRNACETARYVGAVMRRLGWRGELTSCAQCGGPDQPG